MVSDAVLRRKLFQASTQHTPRLRRFDHENGSWMALVGCKCGWNGIQIHEHQMDELVAAVRSAYEIDQLALSRLEMLVEDFPANAVPTVPIAEIKNILMGDVIV